jgi:hypothetical protein
MRNRTPRRVKMPTKDDLERLAKDGKNITQVAALYGVTRDTVTNWRRKLGVTERVPGGAPKRLRYDRMDRLIRDGLMDIEIAEMIHCTQMSVCNRRAKLQVSPIMRPRMRRGKYSEEGADVPFIPPAERESRWKAAMRKRGFDDAWFSGPAAKEGMRAGGFV